MHRSLYGSSLFDGKEGVFLAAPYLSLFVSDWVPLWNLDTKSDFGYLRLFRHLVRVMSTQKDKQTKRFCDVGAVSHFCDV